MIVGKGEGDKEVGVGMIGSSLSFGTEFRSTLVAYACS